jgi:asparagine synthase (glutamine-hydrolysing)
MARRGAMPNPDRFYSDDSFASDHFAALLDPAFQARVQPDASLDVQREIFARPQSAGELHRLMYLDLKMTIAESDLVKVVRASKAAGIDVSFPYLDWDLVQYTGRLAEDLKVRRLEKRFLFKRAMADILPAEVLSKKKHGFGVPTSVWLRRGGALRDMVNDIVLAPRALSRGYFNAAYVRELIARHERGAWDNSSEIFRLLMLELWHRRYLDARA